jgi:hypothetical protein
MSKKLQVAGILDELEGASLFFAKQPTSTPRQPEPETVKTVSISPAPENKPELKREEPTQTMQTDNHETMHARMHALKHESMITSSSNDLKHDSVEAIRKSVKQVGKEEFYLRLTPAEKSEVAKVVYTFNELSVGEGRKISANDIGRIGLHQLLIDYHENGEKSILVRVLSALNA